MAQGHKRVFATRRLWLSLSLGGKELLFNNITISSPWYQGVSAALSPATQNAMSLDIEGKWGRFPLPILL